MAMFKAAALASVALLVTYLYRRVQYARYKQYEDIPQLQSSMILGHLKLFGELLQTGPKDRHPDRVFEQMHQMLGRPSMMMVDMRPLNSPVVLLTTHQLAEQLSTPTKELPMAALKMTFAHVIPLFGKTSLITANGAHAKSLRKRYATAFAPSHIMALLPSMVHTMSIFVEHVEEHARTGDVFTMSDLLKLMTFDIIGTATLGTELRSLPRKGEPQGEFASTYMKLFQLYLDDPNDQPWWIAPGLWRKRKVMAAKLDEMLKDIIRRKHQDEQAGETNDKRTILGLSIQADEELTTELLDETCDQVKTFLLAGHDTAATVIAWVLYYLERTPHALKAARKELDDLLGHDTDPATVMATLASEAGPGVIRNMTYISAVIKEVQRLQPPGSSARQTVPGSGWTLTDEKGKQHCLDGTLIYLIPYLIHRDRKVFGETAEDFLPERWLDKRNDTIPVPAWRGFERGPRACIGIDFALAEMKLVIAILIRRFDFVKVGLGEVDLDESGQLKLDEHGVARCKSDLYSTRQVNPRPADGMKMRVKLRK